jgi:hypothetical protein
MARGRLRLRILGMGGFAVESADNFFLQAACFGRFLCLDHSTSQFTEFLARKLPLLEILPGESYDLVSFFAGKGSDLRDDFRSAHEQSLIGTCLVGNARICSHAHTERPTEVPRTLLRTLAVDGEKAVELMDSEGPDDDEPSELAEKLLNWQSSFLIFQNISRLAFQCFANRLQG